MANFISPGSESVKMLSDELEKKIEEVNISMVFMRGEAARFMKMKDELELNVKELEDKKVNLNQEIPPLQDRKDSLSSDLMSLRDDIRKSTNELKEINNQIDNAKLENEEEIKKITVFREEMQRREKELKDQEAVLRVYATGLEAKEKKLDVYADRVKRLLDSVKSD